MIKESSTGKAGWGRKRGSVHPGDELLGDPATYGACVYSHADWSRAYKSVKCEKEAVVVPVEGRLPRELANGVLYRNGPALFERGGKEYKHMLDGDVSPAPHSTAAAPPAP